MRRVWILLATAIAIVVVLLPTVYVFHNNDRKPPEDFFFGVSYGLETAEEAKLLIDKVKDYTNFFLVNSWDISTNETALNEVCDYAAKADLSFIVFFDYISVAGQQYPHAWHAEWVTTAKTRCGDKFHGIYIYEEPGGKQIDTGSFDEFTHDRQNLFENVTTYSEAADVFVTELPLGLSFQYLLDNNITKYVSDYALYWFDYLAGYDTVFVELGWNHSTPQHIGLCRGAATAQNKDWGSIIVWKSPRAEPASVKSGEEMLQDMLTSYETEAKYVIVFNYPKYPEDNPYGTLLDEHFNAMQQFWQHVTEHPEDYGKTKANVAFVLPKDYGWGMRNPEENIWGFWPADERSQTIWENMNKLTEKYGLQLDIVYDDARFNYQNYDQVYLWNATIN